MVPNGQPDGQNATNSGGDSMRKIVLVAMAICVSGAWAATDSAPNSATTSTSISEEKATGSGLKDILRDRKYEEEKKLTDLELRAYAGSRSRYSLQFNLGYAGPPVNELADANKPNPDNRPGDPRTNLSGNASMRYRINGNTGINFGTGVIFYTPVQAVKGEQVDVDRRKSPKNYGVNDPIVSVDRSYIIDKTQLRSALRASYTTTDNYVQRGQVGMTGFSQYVKYTPGTTRFIFGAQLALDYFAYDRAYKPYVSKKDTGDGTVSKYYINFIPSVEYKITDTLNFNTSAGYPYQNLRSDPAWWRWNHPLTTWRVGVGWAITHDIYINPYVNFFMESPAFNSASASVNTTFSIF